MNIFALSRRNLENQLIESGIEEEEARQEAILILEHVTGLSVTAQIVSDMTALEPSWQAEFERILKKRQARMPIQYILGKARFMGLDLDVKPGVLIPRPDTETLVKSVFDQAKGRGAPGKIAEIGVGAGPIAISLLRYFQTASLFACDISEEAVAISSLNASRYGVADRLELVTGDWRTTLPAELDLIVSNPPYLAFKEKQGLAKEIGDYEPRSALFDKDDDGLGFFRAFAVLLPKHLKQSEGWLAVEFGDRQSMAVASIFERCGWREVTIGQDVHGLARVLTALVPL